MCPWLPEGLLMTQWAPAGIRNPRFPGSLVAWGPPGDLGAPSRAGGPLLSEILGTCGVPGYCVGTFPLRKFDYWLAASLSFVNPYINCPTFAFLGGHDVSRRPIHMPPHADNSITT